MNFLHEISRSEISEVHNPNESSSDEMQWLGKQQKPRRAYTGNPGHSLGDCGRNKQDKIVAGGKDKKYLARHCEVCAARKKRSETKCIYQFCIVSHHKGSCFEKYCSNRKLLNSLYTFFISLFNQLDAQNLFHSKFYFTPLHVSSTCAHHQEVRIALHSLWYHHTYRCDDTRGCVMQF